MLKSYFKYFIYLYVFIGYIAANAGSYDDFFIAIKRDDARTIEQLLWRGFDPNTVNPDGQFGLILALREPSLKVTKLLIQWPATRVEVRTTADESPLMLAALMGDLEICKQLIARDADVNKPGWTALHYAATGGHVEVVRLLLNEHAYIDAASPNGSTPLMVAAMYGNIATVRLLLESGADVLVRNEANRSAADFANHGGKTDVAALIDAYAR